ncbi:hypothetical protein AUP68_15422 [Ilyonectria robusta]
MYHSGQMLDLQLEGGGLPICVCIEEILPRRERCSEIAMHVRVLSCPGGVALPSRATLKLYDTNHVSEYPLPPGFTMCVADVLPDFSDWSPTPGYECIDVTAAKEFMLLATVDKARVYTSISKHGERPGDWDGVKHRAYIHSQAKQTRDWEVEVYDSLRAHQGQHIRHFYASVNHYTDPTSAEPFGDSPELLTVPGVLVERVDGFRLWDLCTQTDESEWYSVVEGAIKAKQAFVNHQIKLASYDAQPANRMGGVLKMLQSVLNMMEPPERCETPSQKARVDKLVERTMRAIGNRGHGLNYHLRPDNMLVVRDKAAEGGYRFVMVDFSAMAESARSGMGDFGDE